MTAKNDILHRCIRCGTVYPHGFTPRCKACTGLVEVYHDLAGARIHDDDDPLRRYFDLLPIKDADHLLSLGEGNTPCVHAGALGARLGLDRVYLKVEAPNPTGTTKDRMAAVVLSLLHELGLREFSTSSTGNSSNALANGIAQHPFFRMHLFMGEHFGNRFRYRHPGIEVHVLEGQDFTDAFNYAKQNAQDHRLPFEAGFFNPARREGLKLAYFEAVEQVPHPIDWYVQASSSAMGVYGTAKGARELVAMGRIARSPRMVCVQQASCAPMARAFAESAPEILPHHIVHNPNGIAKAILRGNPSGCYPYVYEMLRDTDGTAVVVNEEEIREARALLVEHEGLDCCYNSATTIAALRKLAADGTVGRDDCVLLNLTGGPEPEQEAPQEPAAMAARADA
jgi:threonine synthase